MGKSFYLNAGKDQMRIYAQMSGVVTVGLGRKC